MTCAPQSKQDRGLDYAQTISFEKRQQQWDKEEFLLRKLQRDEGRRLERSQKTYVPPYAYTYRSINTCVGMRLMRDPFRTHSTVWSVVPWISCAA